MGPSLPHVTQDRNSRLDRNKQPGGTGGMRTEGRVAAGHRGVNIAPLSNTTGTWTVRHGNKCGGRWRPRDAGRETSSRGQRFSRPLSPTHPPDDHESVTVGGQREGSPTGIFSQIHGEQDERANVIRGRDVIRSTSGCTNTAGTTRRQRRADTSSRRHHVIGRRGRTHPAASRPGSPHSELGRTCLPGTAGGRRGCSAPSPGAPERAPRPCSGGHGGEPLVRRCSPGAGGELEQYEGTVLLATEGTSAPTSGRAQYTEEEIEWYGLTMFEAIKKQMNLEAELFKPKPLKHLYRAQLLQKLRDGTIPEVVDTPEQSESWFSKMNPFKEKDSSHAHPS
ncbi:uncharacterized protein LOC134531613 isoform X1 [Bacillus rossius redtenbacheri]|uniref:uncharacterized protein LOC134531613 isoform X1 n=1 Tax=Bacillus rossius redtenbacheri TaxID=93214 RepID=UPI002FDDD331